MTNMTSMANMIHQNLNQTLKTVLTSVLLTIAFTACGGADPQPIPTESGTPLITGSQNWPENIIQNGTCKNPAHMLQAEINNARKVRLKPAGLNIPLPWPLQNIIPWDQGQKLLLAGPMPSFNSYGDYQNWLPVSFSGQGVSKTSAQGQVHLRFLDQSLRNFVLQISLNPDNGISSCVTRVGTRIKLRQTGGNLPNIESVRLHFETANGQLAGPFWFY